MIKNNLKINKLKGFTLIELLVVITIIGILAVIVLPNISGVRGRGQDTAVKEQMGQIRATTEIYYQDYYGYSSAAQANANSGNCTTAATWTGSVFGEADVQRAILGIKRNSAAEPKCYTGQGGSLTSQSFMITVKLRSNGRFWCVDSFGSSKEIATEPSISGAADAMCP